MIEFRYPRFEESNLFYRDLLPSKCFKPGVKEWLREHFGVEYYGVDSLYSPTTKWRWYICLSSEYYYLLFKNKSDAVLFKLTWG